MKKNRWLVGLLLISAFLFGSISSCASKPKDDSAPDIITADGEEIDIIKKPVQKTEKQLKKEKKEREAAEKKAAAKAASDAKAAEKKAKEAEKKEKDSESKKASDEKKAEEKAAKDAEKQAAKEDAAAKKAAELAEKNKNIAGWDEDAETSTFEVIQGIMKFKVNPKRGSFNLFIISDEGKTSPAFATTNEYTSTSFYVRRNGRIVKLNDDLAVKTTAHKLEDGFQIAYKIDNIAFVQLTFTCFNSTVSGPVDTVRVSAVVKSLSKKTADFDLKLLMDTVLGETDRHHFYTFEGNAVKTELATYTAKAFPWFVSKNVNGELQVILNGYDITEPKMVALANYSTLNTKFWEPDLMSARSFDTVLSYNNSAAEIIWPTHKLPVDGTFKEVFYLSVANQEKTPTGYLYIDANLNGEPIEYDEEAIYDANASDNVEVTKPATRKPKPKPVEVEPEPEETKTVEQKPAEQKPDPVTTPVPAVEKPAETPVEKPVEQVKPEPVQEPVKQEPEVQKTEPVDTTKVDSSPKQNPAVEKIKASIGKGVADGKKSVIGKDAAAKKAAEEKAAEEAKKPKQKDEKTSSNPAVTSEPVKKEPEVKYIDKPVTKEQLSPEYIEKLLDRIAELEASGKTVDRDELILLNAELDAILEYLRNK